MATTWILVGDAARARIFAVEKEDGPWQLVEELDHPPGRARTSELVSDRAGRTRPGEQGARAPGMEHMDASERESLRFAEHLGAVLQQGYDDRSYDRLVVVAPPRFLGYLRSVLRDTVTRQIAASIDKDYTHHDEQELRGLLTPHVRTEGAAR